MSSLTERFRTTLDLHEAGVQMMRLRLRRQHPAESDQEIQARLVAWLRAPEAPIPGQREGRWPRS